MRSTSCRWQTWNPHMRNVSRTNNLIRSQPGKHRRYNWCLRQLLVRHAAPSLPTRMTPALLVPATENRFGGRISQLSALSRHNSSALQGPNPLHLQIGGYSTSLACGIWESWEGTEKISLKPLNCSVGYLILFGQSFFLFAGPCRLTYSSSPCVVSTQVTCLSISFLCLPDRVAAKDLPLPRGGCVRYASG